MKCEQLHIYQTFILSAIPIEGNISYIHDPWKEKPLNKDKVSRLIVLWYQINKSRRRLYNIKTKNIFFYYNHFLQKRNNLHQSIIFSVFYCSIDSLSSLSTLILCMCLSSISTDLLVLKNESGYSPNHKVWQIFQHPIHLKNLHSNSNSTIWHSFFLFNYVREMNKLIFICILKTNFTQ
jgi:hypothetical protein